MRGGDPVHALALFAEHAHVHGVPLDEALYSNELRGKSCYVYTMMQPGLPLVKVGRTNNLQRRLSEHRYCSWLLSSMGGFWCLVPQCGSFDMNSC